MSRHSQAGFTLIELILVMAISSSLIGVAFVGQRSLRAQAQFDAAVNRVIATVADARNQALAGVNTNGAGNGVQGCAGAGVKTVFAGVAWTADNSLPLSPLKLDYYKAKQSAPGVGACSYETLPINVPTQLLVNVTKSANMRGGRILFVRTANGSVEGCAITDLSIDVTPFFMNGSCVPGPLSLQFSDADGHSSDVTIDPSGLAKRTN